MRRNVVRAALAIVVMAFAAACQDSTGPREVGTFVLVEVGGDRLPASTMLLPGETVIADTLILFSVSKGNTGRVEHHETNQYLSNVHSAVYSLDYELKNGAWVFLAPPCPPGANCAFAEHTGRLDGDVLTITYRNAQYRTRTYRRVS